MTVVDSTSPKYQRMADHIEEGIRKGRFASGHAIPSVRNLMKSYKLSMSTVVNGLSLLEQRGVVRRMQNRGYFVIDPNQPDPKLKQIAIVTGALAGETQLIHKGVTNALPSGDYTVGVYSSNSDLDRFAELIDQVVRLRPDGVILNSLPKEIFDIPGRGLMEAKIPTVVLGQRVDSLPCDRVDHQGEESAGKFMPYLLEKGYTDITLMSTAPASDPSRQGIVKVVREKLSAIGKELPDNRIITMPSTHGFSHHADPFIDAQLCTESLLRSGMKLKTIVCCHDYPAVGVLRAVLAAGLRVPEDVQLISASRCPVEGISPIKLTTMETYFDERARVGAKLLLRRLDGYDGPAETHYTSSDMIVGQTA